tara:strand:+ start:2561 stop:4348 length:1788 start_codon:yes stop_codon:yes gene_type:complete
MALDIEPASGNAPVVRIGLIITLAVVIQGALLWLLADGLGLRASYATLIAFLAAIAIGYRAYGHFDVHTERFRRKALPGFVLTACSGVCINAVVFTMMTDVFGASHWLAFAVATLALPPALFVLANSLTPDRAMNDRTPVGIRLLVWPAIFFATAAAYTLIFHYQAPYFDDWELVPVWSAVQAGSLEPARLFVQHGGHWVASGYVVMLANAELTDMAHWPVVTISLLISGIGFIGLFDILRRTLSELDEVRSLPLVAAFAAFIYFSLDQSENWLWTWQVSLFASIAGVVWCIALLMRPSLSWARLVLACASAAIAVYGFATAWCLLPIGFFLIAIVPDTSRHRRAFAALAWALLFGLLLWHFTSVRTDYTADMLPDRSALETLFGISQYVANYFTSPVFRGYKPAAALVAPASIVAVLVILWLTWRHFGTRLIAYRGIVALIAFSMGAALLTGLGRWGTFGAEQAFSNRYITISNFAWLGGIVAALILLPKLGRNMRTVFLLALIGFTMAKLVNNVSAYNNARLAMRVNAAACELALHTSDTPEEAMLALSGPQQAIAPRLRMLEAGEVSLFRPAAVKRCQARGDSPRDAPGVNQ